MLVQMPSPPPDLSKTLDQLENSSWGDHEPAWQSHLVLECHRLHKVPLIEFTPENLRIMIGQSLGLGYLAPLALSVLSEDPLIEASYYPGDLLCACLTSEAAYWRAQPELRARLLKVAEEGRSRLEYLYDTERTPSSEAFHQAFAQFVKNT